LYYLLPSLAVNGLFLIFLIAIAARKMGSTPLNKVRHKVRGTTYEIIGFATVQTADSLKDDDRVFVYRDVDDDEMYVRLDREFADGRFEKVD
jgi:hypothetical protein